MVQLTRIYTKGGDKGKTSLGTGKRVVKHNLRIAAIGDVDEANASLGVARLQANQDIDALLSRIQNDLFDVGADLCIPLEKGEEGKLRVDAHQVTYLEEKIDNYNHHLPELKSFVLPAGTALAASLHLARTIVRRAERSVSALKEHEPVNDIVIQYLNRLSDLLFVLARYDNQQNEGDVLWGPGANR